MESNEYKGMKVDFSYFVRMALQNNMAWKKLAMILNDNFSRHCIMLVHCEHFSNEISAYGLE